MKDIFMILLRKFFITIIFALVGISAINESFAMDYPASEATSVSEESHPSKRRQNSSKSNKRRCTGLEDEDYEANHLEEDRLSALMEMENEDEVATLDALFEGEDQGILKVSKEILEEYYEEDHIYKDFSPKLPELTDEEFATVFKDREMLQERQAVLEEEAPQSASQVVAQPS